MLGTFTLSVSSEAEKIAFSALNDKVSKALCNGRAFDANPKLVQASRLDPFPAIEQA